MRDELIEALKRLARGDEAAAEEIVNLFMPSMGDPREKKLDIDVQKND